MSALETLVWGGGRNIGYQLQCGITRTPDTSDNIISMIKKGGVSCGAYFYNELYFDGRNHFRFILNDNKLTLTTDSLLNSNVRCMNLMVVKVYNDYVDCFLSSFGRFVDVSTYTFLTEELFTVTQIQNSKYTLNMTCLTDDPTPRNNSYWMSDETFTYGLPNIWHIPTERGMKFVGNLGYPFRIDIR